MKIYPCPNCNSEPELKEVVFGLTCLISIVCPKCKLVLSQYTETTKKEGVKEEIAQRWRKLSEITFQE